MIFSCYGCTERTDRCHAICPKYIAEKQESEALRKKANAEKAIQAGLNQQRADAIRKVKKNGRHRSRGSQNS